MLKGGELCALGPTGELGLDARGFAQFRTQGRFELFPHPRHTHEDTWTHVDQGIFHLADVVTEVDLAAHSKVQEVRENLLRDVGKRKIAHGPNIVLCQVGVVVLDTLTHHREATMVELCALGHARCA